MIADCQKLTTLFTVNPTTFFLEVDQFADTALGTCEYVVFNLRDSEIEFCDDDWVDIGLQFAQACVPAGFDAGFCEPADRAIAVEFIPLSNEF